MTLQTIDLGAAPDDGNGDDLRVAMDKVNDNFIEAYGTTGTWTPVLAGETTPGTFTYSTATGTYSYLGPLVFLEFEIITSAESPAAVGSMEITGLPVAAVASGGGLILQNWGGVNLPTSMTHIGGRIAASASAIDLHVSGDNVASARLDAANVGTAVKLQGMIMYRRAL